MKHDLIIITSNNLIGQKENIIIQGTRVTIPEFEIFQNPVIHIADIKRRRFKIGIPI